MAELTFGPFTLDDTGVRLLRGRGEVRLRPRAFHALRVLLAHRGQPVSYEQLTAEAWEGTFVSQHTVDVTVGEVRKTLGEYGRWIVRRPRVGYMLDVPMSDETVRKGWHFWERRTREGFELAADCFEQAVAQNPTDFLAYEGLSATYLTLATFGMRPPRVMYPRFLDAHDRAVELGGLRPELRCNRGHALHMFERRYAEAETELLTVLREKPGWGHTYVRLSMLYSTAGRFEEAVNIVQRGYKAAPLLTTLPLSETSVLFRHRDYDAAVAVGAKAIELHPYLQVGRAFYGQALEFSDRMDEALAQYRLASLMSPDLPWMRALEGTCLAKMGRRREACAILADLERLREREYVDAYYMAVFREQLGQRPGALVELERAYSENSGSLYALRVDPKMDPFLAEPRFRRICAALEAEGQPAPHPR
jgi:DNA-binding winged helix-turn-helix (wHTH) protein/tetratricopeptide (TPR) repeat protein